MGSALQGNRFYKLMGMVLLVLVITGFGISAIVRELNPVELPLLFHVHAIVYLAWFTLFIVQVYLIGANNRELHKRLGQFSVIIILAMLVSGWMMAQGSYDRGISPIPDISIQQFMAFPIFDLIGLTLFYSLAIANRSNAEFHKRAMLLTGLAILDPAVARVGIIVGFPPFPLVASILIVGAVMWHDRKVLDKIHAITWFAFAWIFIRLGFVFGVASTDAWSNLANSLFS